MRYQLSTALLLASFSVSAFAQVTGDLTYEQDQFIFSANEQTVVLQSTDCQALMQDGETLKHVKIEGLDANLMQTGALKLSLDQGKSCTFDNLPIVAMSVPVMSAPMPVPTAPAPMSIHKNDTMSRQFTIGPADLTPVSGSTRPSAVVLFSQGTNAKKSNYALCNSFVKLETVAQATESTGVAEINQVVTKLPVTTELDQMNDNCDEILAVYDYQLATEELKNLNPTLRRSNGPFVAIYNPNSMQINQLIDLNGATEAEIAQFGKNWNAIFTEYAVKGEQVSGEKVVNTEKSSIWTMLKNLFKSSVCTTDPNLIYIFNPSAGQIADAICKANQA